MMNHAIGEDAYHSAIRAKLAALAEPLARLPWRFQVFETGDAPNNAAEPGLDDTSWQPVSLPHTWSSLDGEGWFRAPVALPDEIEGIPLGGAPLEWDLFLTIGATIYVDGEARYTEPSWADTRAVPLLLTESFEPGETLQLAVRSNAGDGFALFAGSTLRSLTLDAVAFDLELALAQADFTRFLAESADAPGMAVWSAAVGRLDLEALDANNWSRWNASVAEMRAGLAPFEAPAKQYTVHLIAHSHIDMNWLWPMQETVDVCRRDFSAMTRLMNIYPEFRFSQSQAATYRLMQQSEPELFEEMRRQVAAGRWEITANTWVEGDLNMAAGETLVRQLLHTRRYIEREFDVRPLVCWEPDTFGHTAAFPQLLAQSDVKFYYFCRAGKRYPLFWWEAPSKSRVLACQDPNGYNGVVNPASVMDALLDFTGPAGIKRGLLVYGVGDHGGSGTARDIRAARRLDADPLMPRVAPSTAAEFYEAALADLDAGPGRDSLPVVRGELNTVFEGCYTSHGDIKRLNRDAENALLTAETLATLAKLSTDAAYPAEVLAEAWRTVCFHQFHDILCGCAIGVTYREADEAMSAILGTAEQITNDAARALAIGKMQREAPEPAIVVLNPLSWTRDDVVSVPLAALPLGAFASVIDDQGNRLPAQVSEGQLLFVARDVPGFGARTYTPSAETVSGATEAVRSSGENVLENDLLEMRVHPRSGAIDRLVDKANGRSLTGPLAGWGPEANITSGMLNRLQILWEQPHPMSAWNIGDITRVDHLIDGADVRVIESGPVRGVIEVDRSFLHSTLKQHIILYAGLPRIDFETEVDWHERGSAHRDAPMLRATFTPHFGHTQATFETAFAAVSRPANGREVPALRWADLSEGEAYGLSLLNDGKYGHQAQGNTLGLTLVRASYEPDVNPDEGLHRFTYALFPHDGDWRIGDTPERAAELNQPLVALATTGGEGALPAGTPLLQFDATPTMDSAGRVMLSALKLAEDQPPEGIAVTVRLYEAHGKPAQATIRVERGLAAAYGLSPIEEISDNPMSHHIEVYDDHVCVHLQPHEITTIGLTMSPAHSDSGERT